MVLACDWRCPTQEDGRPGVASPEELLGSWEGNSFWWCQARGQGGRSPIDSLSIVWNKNTRFSKSEGNSSHELPNWISYRISAIIQCIPYSITFHVLLLLESLKTVTSVTVTSVNKITIHSKCSLQQLLHHNMYLLLVSPHTRNSGYHLMNDSISFFYAFSLSTYISQQINFIRLLYTFTLHFPTYASIASIIPSSFLLPSTNG